MFEPVLEITVDAKNSLTILAESGYDPVISSPYTNSRNSVLLVVLNEDREPCLLISG